MKTVDEIFEDLENFILSAKILFLSNEALGKELYCNLRGNLELWHNGEKILEVSNKATMIKAYNDIRNLHNYRLGDKVKRKYSTEPFTVIGIRVGFIEIENEYGGSTWLHHDDLGLYNPDSLE